MQISARTLLLLPALAAASMVPGCPADGPVGANDDDAASPATACDDATELADRVAELQTWFEALSDGVATRPAPLTLPEDSNGTLSVGFGARVLPLLGGPSGTHAAAMELGAGRVVVFSGQDFLAGNERSTLLGEPAVAALLDNAARWVGGTADPLRVRVHSPAVEAAFSGHATSVAPIVETVGLREIRDWSAAALADVDVAVVQVNEWGTLHISEADVAALRAWVEDGGGLLLSGSKMHWSWWLSDQSDAFPGDALLDGTGVTFDTNSVRDLTEAELRFSAQSDPESLWCSWVNGDPVDADDAGRLAGLFQGAQDAGRTAEVDRGLARLRDETPALPVSVTDPLARMSAQVGVGLRGATWPAAHPWTNVFPGDVEGGAERVQRTVAVDTTNTRDKPLGLYAAGGDVVTVTVPAEHVGTGLVLRVGDRYDDLRYLDHITEWRRAPLLLQETPVTEAVTVIGNGFGGPLYVDVPDGYGAQTIDVQVDGAVPMGLFVAGTTTASAFQEQIAAGAPQAILMADRHVRLVVNADQAAQVTDPDATMTFWNGFIQRHMDLAREPIPRAYESHWLFDPQVGWGYANATSQRIAYPDLSAGWALRTETGNEDWWLFGHELGHQFQTSDWTSGDVTEVCVNLWTMYTLNSYLNEGGNFETVGHQDNVIDHAALQGMRWSEAGLFEKLEMYRQLVFEFGWDTYEQTMASYYDPAYPRETYGSFMDGFALRFSTLTQRDLTPFFDTWEYPYSAEARGTIQSWGHEPWIPPGWTP